MKKAIRILLVEDEVVTAMLMEKQLEGVGYPVSEHVTTGEDAIICVKQNPPDLILMDIRLAGEMNGIKAASVIKSEFAIPVIFISGYDDKAIREKAEKTGPLGYLVKPLKIGKLKMLIDTHFE